MKYQSFIAAAIIFFAFISNPYAGNVLISIGFLLVSLFAHYQCIMNGKLIDEIDHIKSEMNRHKP